MNGWGSFLGLLLLPRWILWPLIAFWFVAAGYSLYAGHIWAGAGMAVAGVIVLNGLARYYRARGFLGGMISTLTRSARDLLGRLRG